MFVLADNSNARNSRSDSNGGDLSSSSGTPSDSHRSPALNKAASTLGEDGWPKPKEPVKGWTPSPTNQSSPNMPGPGSFTPAHTQGFTSGLSARPPAKPDTDYAWSGPPSQPNNSGYSNDRNGRPLSPDGWPTKKTEVRGHTESVPDLLSDYLEKQQPKIVVGSSSGWKATSSNVSGNTITAATGTPLPASEMGHTEASRAGPSSETAAAPQAAPVSQGWRTSTPKAVSPVRYPPIAPVPSLPQPTQAVEPVPNPVSASTSHVSAPINAPERPSSQTIRVVSGWTVKVPFGTNDEVVELPPVPSVPKEYSQQPVQPSTAVSGDDQSAPNGSTSGNNEVWVLPNADAIKNNNWTPTTRRSRISRENKGPTYIPASSFGYVEVDDSSDNRYNDASTRSGYDDNSIRPSESVSNVGVRDDTTYRTRHTQHGQDMSNQPRYKPMRQFQGEKDSDIGSNGSSGSLNDNPNVRAGGWQRSPLGPVDALDSTLPASKAQPTSWQNQAVQQPQQSMRNARQHESSGPASIRSQQQLAHQSESRHTPITAPMPRRWDSASQQLVGDLERAATPRGISAAAASGHGRSVSTATGTRSGSMSIRGASKYHAESLMLREEVCLSLFQALSILLICQPSKPIMILMPMQLDKIRAQVSKYESVLSSMDEAVESDGSELVQELNHLRQENQDLRTRVEQLEFERREIYNTLLPVMRRLEPTGKKVQRNGTSADHLGDYINGNGSASLQDLTMISHGGASQQAPNRQVGW